MMNRDNNYDSYAAMGSMITQGFYPRRDPREEQIRRYNREHKKSGLWTKTAKIVSLTLGILTTRR